MRTNTSIAAALLALAAQAVSAETLLCADWESSIAEDMRILESDLTYERAEKALATLNSHKSEPIAGDMKFGYLNSEKILRGYALRQVALALRTPEAAKSFCSWLVEEGFWYD